MRIALIALLLVLATPVHAETSAEICGGQSHCEEHPRPGKYLRGRASVIDGDTIEIHGTRIRLHGIDAPEGRQPCHKDGKLWRCGQAASVALSDRIGEAVVTCDVRDVDRYGRKVAVCFRREEDLNAWLVRNGWALAYRRYSLAYVEDEDDARKQRRGIWASEFVPPWEWRRKGR